MRFLEWMVFLFSCCGGFSYLLEGFLVFDGSGGSVGLCGCLLPLLGVWSVEDVGGVFLGVWERFMLWPKFSLKWWRFSSKSWPDSTTFMI